MTFRNAIRAVEQALRPTVESNNGSFDVASTPANLLELLNVGGDKWRCLLLFESATPIADSRGGGYKMRFSITVQGTGLLDREMSHAALKSGGLLDKAQLILERLRMVHFQTSEGRSHPEIDPEPAEWLELKWLEGDLPAGIRQLQLVGSINFSTTTPSERQAVVLDGGA